MNIIRRAALVSVASLTAASCGGGSENIATSQMELEQQWLDPNDGAGNRSQSPDSEQVQYITQALAAAGHIVAMTSDAQADEVGSFMEKHAVPARLTSLGPVALSENVKFGTNDFFIVGVSQLDAGINPISDYYIPASANGVYTEELNTLFLYSDSALKDSWQGIITLHEATHAKNRAEGKNDPYEEASTRIFQHRLAEEVFGTPYTQSVLETMNTVREEFKKSFELGSAFTIPVINIEGITEPDSSEQEKRFANSTVLFDALFRLMDEFGRGTLEEKQQLFDILTLQMVQG